MTSHPPSKLHKYAFIDALRGIAFLGVFACHAAPHLARLGCPEASVRIGLQGGIGVQLFFIASALTLMLSLDSRSKVEEHPLRDFFLRRFFRIAPLFYAATLFYGIAFGGNDEARVPRPLTIGSYVSTLTFTHGWNPRWINQVVPGGWSIAVEMTFYLMVPFFHAHLKSLRQALFATVLVYLLGWIVSEMTGAWLDSRGPSDLPGMDEAFVHYWLPYQLYRFFAGFTLYFLIRDRLRTPRDPASARSDLIRSLALLGAALVVLGASALGRLPKALTAPTCTAGLVLFCWSLAVSPLPLFVNAATRWIGKLSFSAYVTHFAAIYLIDRAFEPIGLTSGSRHWSIGVSAFLLASLGVTLGASELTFRWIEKPGQSLGRRLIDRLRTADGIG